MTPEVRGLAAGPVAWYSRRYHAVTCTDTLCDPGCDVAVPALTGGEWWPELHRCPVLSAGAGFAWTVKYGPDGLSTCSCRARVRPEAVPRPADVFFVVKS